MEDTREDTTAVIMVADIMAVTTQHITASTLTHTTEARTRHTDQLSQSTLHTDAMHDTAVTRFTTQVHTTPAGTCKWD